MSSEIGSVGTTTYYLDMQYLGWHTRAQLIKVTVFQYGSPSVYVTDLGKVRSRAQAERLVLDIIAHDRRLDDEKKQSGDRAKYIATGDSAHLP